MDSFASDSSSDSSDSDSEEEEKINFQTDSMKHNTIAEKPFAERCPVRSVFCSTLYYNRFVLKQDISHLTGSWTNTATFPATIPATFTANAAN